MNYRLNKAKSKHKPYLNDKVIDTFAKILNKNMVGWEFGSGMSTLWISGRVKSLTSVEHSKKWYRKISRLCKKHRKNVTILFRKPSRKGSKSYYGGGRWRTFYQDYVQSIESVKNDSLDFVFIDGRARVACIRHSVSKVKKGGYIILDDSRRKTYQDTINTYLSNWETRQISRTSFYRKK